MATPTTHPKPDLPQATWDAIKAVIGGIPPLEDGSRPGFVRIAKACRAARRAGQISGCSNQQLDAALKHLADAGQLGHADDSIPEAVVMPKNDPLRININRHLDVVYDEQAQRARVLVDGKPFLHCSFIVASIPVDTNDDENATSPAANNRNDSPDQINSIDDLAASLEHDARVLEVTNARRYLTPAEEVLAHASNLQAWAENDYDTRLLHSNIAFPLLKELVKVGDDKATRAFNIELNKRITNGNLATRKLILHIGGDLLQDPDQLLPLLSIHDDETIEDYHSDIPIYYEPPTSIRSLQVLVRLVKEGNSRARKILDENISLIYDGISKVPYKGNNADHFDEIAETVGNLLSNRQLVSLSWKDESLVYILYKRMESGDREAGTCYNSLLKSWFEDENYCGRAFSFIVSRARQLDERNKSDEEDLLVKHEISNLYTSIQGNVQRAINAIDRYLDKIPLEILKNVFMKQPATVLGLFNRISSFFYKMERAYRNTSEENSKEYSLEQMLFNKIITETFDFISTNRRLALCEALFQNKDGRVFLSEKMEILVNYTPLNIVEVMLGQIMKVDIYVSRYSDRTRNYDDCRSDDEVIRQLLRKEGLSNVKLKWAVDHINPHVQQMLLYKVDIPMDIAEGLVQNAIKRMDHHFLKLLTEHRSENLLIQLFRHATIELEDMEEFRSVLFRLLQSRDPLVRLSILRSPKLLRLIKYNPLIRHVDYTIDIKGEQKEGYIVDLILELQSDPDPAVAQAVWLLLENKKIKTSH